MGRWGGVRAAGMSLLMAVIALSALRAAAQATEAPQNQKKLIPRTTEQVAKQREDERHIALDVVVTDGAGKPVSGLEQQDFTILDNDHPQQLLSFKAVEGPKADPPVEMVLVIDLVNTTFHNVAYERDQLAKFLRQNNGKLAYPTSLIIFGETGTQVQPHPTRDGNDLANLLESTNSSLRVIGRSAGFYGAEERLQGSYQMMNQLVAYEGSKPGRKLVIWLSPGWALLEGPSVQFSTQSLHAFFHSIVDFTNLLRTSRMTLYVVDPTGGDGNVMHTFYYESYLKGIKKWGDAGPGNLALQVLTMHSGGRVMNVGSDIVGELNACVEDAAAYYEMSFMAAPAERADEYHALTVKVNRPGLKARTNTSYYGQP